MIRSVPAGVLLCLLAAGACAQPAAIPLQIPKIKFRYVCLNDGRYWTSSGGGEKHYCWDGKHYSKSSGGVPDYILEYWANKARESQAVRERLSKNAFPGRAAAERSRAAGGGAKTVATVEQSTKDTPVPVGRERFAGLAEGAEREAVIAALGAPHGSMSNLGSEGDEESLTYLIEGGGEAKVRLKKGKVTAIRLPGS